jgi:hypothetical protein
MTDIALDDVDNFDPAPPLDDPDFKEDAVREDITRPLLVRLGYASSGDSRIIRSKRLAHSFVMIGTTRRPVNTIPDYLLSVENKYAWVLDAKAPDEVITSGENVEQAYSYAIHPEVRVKLFALCNGREFVLFDIEDRAPLMHFQMSDLEENWRQLDTTASTGISRGRCGRSCKSTSKPSHARAIGYWTPTAGAA